MIKSCVVLVHYTFHIVLFAIYLIISVIISSAFIYFHWYLKNYRKLWNEIKNQIKTINGGKSVEYKKDIKKIRLDSNDADLPLGKILSKIINILILSIVVRSVFQNENKYYPQIHIHECECECEYELLFSNI